MHLVVVCVESHRQQCLGRHGVDWIISPNSWPFSTITPLLSVCYGQMNFFALYLWTLLCDSIWLIKCGCKQQYAKSKFKLKRHHVYCLHFYPSEKRRACSPWLLDPRKKLRHGTGPLQLTNCLVIKKDTLIVECHWDPEAVYYPAIVD